MSKDSEQKWTQIQGIYHKGGAKLGFSKLKLRPNFPVSYDMTANLSCKFLMVPQ